MERDQKLQDEPAMSSTAWATSLGVAAATLAVTGCGAASGGSESAGVSPVVTPDNGPVAGEVPRRFALAAIGFTPDAGLPITVNSLTGTTTVWFHLDGSTATAGLEAPPSSSTEVKHYAFSGPEVGTVTVTFNPPALGVIRDFPAEAASPIQTLSDVAFAGNVRDVSGLIGLNKHQQIKKLVRKIPVAPFQAYPAWIDEQWPLSYDGMTHDQRKNRDLQILDRTTNLKKWWFTQMVVNPQPLQERLLLFWHNIFTSSLDVSPPEIILRQHRLYRDMQLRTLPEFLKAMSRDPAMLMYLDGDQNVKDAPNENFARELMELFTFGEASTSLAYTEGDIVELARCFTGYSLNATGAYYFNPAKHDADAKVLFGKAIAAGNVQDAGGDGDIAIDRILEQRVAGRNACAYYLTNRLWREFHGDKLPGDEAEITRIAELFATDFAWDLKRFYEEVAASPVAAAVDRSGTRYRSPVELFVTYFRALNITMTWDNLHDVVRFLIRQEQSLFSPPNVAGWPGGAAWISTKSVLNRDTNLWSVAAGDNVVAQDLRPIVERLLMVIPARRSPASNASASQAARFLVQDPAFQVR